MMQESKRQKQVARQIQDELTTIFLKEDLNMIDGGMVSIAKVTVTSDLLEARIALSFFQVKNNDEALKKIVDKTSEIRRQLGNKLRHQLRRIPTLAFFIDDTLDYVFKMEGILKNLNKNDAESSAE